MTESSGSLLNVGQQQPRTRKRKSQSCLQCRTKKKQCNRMVPGCNQCKMRGDADLCRWGDERDRGQDQIPLQRRRVDAHSDDVAARDNTSVVVTPSPASQVEESNSLFDTLSRADIHTDLHNEPSFSMHNQATPDSHSSSSMKSLFSRNQAPSSRTSNASDLGRKSITITCTPARKLVATYQEQGSRIVGWIDTVAVAKALDESRSNDIREIRYSKPHLYALISVVCASSLILLPATYTICMGLIDKSSELGSLLDRLEEDAFDALGQTMFAQPSIIGLQALAIYQLNLSPRMSERMHIIRMDELIRGCRRMGLDRLGSVQDDERMWLEEDLKQAETPSSNLPGMVSSHWASETFVRRNRMERNRGRAIWSFAVAKEWISSRISASCNLHPDSYTTSYPTPYSGSDSGGVSLDEELLWSFVMRVSEVTYKYFKICSDAQAYGKSVDYQKILQLDNELMLELERRPQWLRAEANLGQGISDWRSFEAIMISSTLYNRMSSLHRPFLALSRSEPEKYGLSASRSFDYAILCIRIMKEGLQHNVLMLKQLTFHFRLLQAALVVITYLFLGYDTLSQKETISIYEDLNFAISAFKNLSIVDPGGFFHSQGEKLEELLAKAARHIRQSSRYQNEYSNLPSPSMFQQSSTEPQRLNSFQEHYLMSNLDDQLLRLSQAWPLGTEDQDNNQIWSDLFSMLDSGPPLSS